MPAAVITAPTPGHPYDNGIYRAATRTLPAPTVTVDDLPAYCGPLTDMGRDQRCPRAAKVFHLHNNLDEITRERTRQPRLRNDWQARNLAGWITFAERRLAYYLATWTLPDCRCGEHAFTEPTHDTEQALPACTC